MLDIVQYVGGIVMDNLLEIVAISLSVCSCMIALAVSAAVASITVALRKERNAAREDFAAALRATDPQCQEG